MKVRHVKGHVKKPAEEKKVGREIVALNSFRKDLENCQRNPKLDMDDIQKVIRDLAANGRVGSKYRPHALGGRYDGCWDLHVRPDWVLIYRLTKTEVVLVRTGTHSELFK